MKSHFDLASLPKQSSFYFLSISIHILCAVYIYLYACNMIYTQRWWRCVLHCTALHCTVSIYARCISISFYILKSWGTPIILAAVGSGWRSSDVCGRPCGRGCLRPLAGCCDISSEPGFFVRQTRRCSQERDQKWWLVFFWHVTCNLR